MADVSTSPGSTEGTEGAGPKGGSAGGSAEDDVAELDDRGRTAESVGDIPATGWKDVLGRVKVEAKRDQVTLLSAGVAFYSLLALIPALVAAVSVYGLVADPDQVQRQVEDVASGLPGSAQELLTDQLDRVVGSSSAGLSIGAIVGVLLAIWTASSGIRHLIEALNMVYGEEDGRGLVKGRLVSLAMTAAAVVGAAVSVGLIVVLPAVLNAAGLGGVATVALNLARWPLLALAFFGAVAALYHFGPDRTRPEWTWTNWGAGLATVIWLLGSALFSFYAERFGSFNETYGALAGVIVLMLWLLLTCASVLLGAELNSELERQTFVDTTVGNPKMMGHRGANAADTAGAIDD